MDRLLIMYLLGSILLLTPPSSGKADWVNLTGAENARNIAEIFIEQDQVRVKIEIFVGDLGKFEQLLPDAFFKALDIDRPPESARLKRFSETGLKFVTTTGETLQAELVVVEPRLRVERQSLFAGKLNPFTGQIIPGPPEDKRVLFVELVYPFTSRPSSLTISPPVDDNGFPSVPIGFLAYHGGVPVVDFRFLSEPSTLSLDWDDPWYSFFDKKVLKRWQQSGIKTFLYIEPYEVRHETLVRVKDLAAWLDLGLLGSEYIEAQEWPRLKERVGEFFFNQSNVTIDGMQKEKILDRISFIKYTMTRTYFLETPERLPLNSAMIGVIITYPTEGMPQNVTVDWDLFNDRIQQVPTSTVDPAGPFPYMLSPDDNVLVWQNFLKKYRIPTVSGVEADRNVSHLQIPLLTILSLLGFLIMLRALFRQAMRRQPVGRLVLFNMIFLVSAIIVYPVTLTVPRPGFLQDTPTEAEALPVLQNLLKNVYRAFDFRDENVVYDRLQKVVTGDLLTEIYLQNRKSFEVKQAGGAQARVKEVTIEDVSVQANSGGSPGVLFDAYWSAQGEVGHWGHIHTRKNRYHAEILAEPVDGFWKITQMDILDEERIDPYAQSLGNQEK